MLNEGFALMQIYIFGPFTGNSGPFARVTATDEPEARKKLSEIDQSSDWTDRLATRCWRVTPERRSVSRREVAIYKNFADLPLY
jgi:hypothetical protein